MIVLVNNVYLRDELCLLGLLTHSSVVFIAGDVMNVSRKPSVRANYVDNVKFWAKLLSWLYCHLGGNWRSAIQIAECTLAYYAIWKYCRSICATRFIITLNCSSYQRLKRRDYQSGLFRPCQIPRRRLPTARGKRQRIKKIIFWG